MSVISSLSDIKSMYSGYSKAFSALSMKNKAMQQSSNANDGMFGMSGVLSGMDNLKKGYYKDLYSGKIDATETDSAAETTASANTTLKNASLALKSSAAALDDESLYAKDSEGKMKTDDIYKKVNEFVGDYNTMVKKAADATDLKVLQKGVVMVNSTSTSKGLLNRIGITINSDNTLSVDKDKLANAEAYELKAAFSDSYSYGSKIEQKASQISNMIGSSSATYSNTGALSYSYASIFNMNLHA